MIRELQYDAVFDAQRHFRILLDAMARPGKIGQLNNPVLQPPAGLQSAAALIGFALLDSESSCWTGSSTLDEYLVLNTGTALAPPAQADFLFASGPEFLPELWEAKTGHLHYPEQGASLILQLEALSEEALPDGLGLELKGPGVKGSKNLFLQGLSLEWLALIEEKNAEYPLGVDVYFTDWQGKVSCLPRSNQFSTIA